MIYTKTGDQGKTSLVGGTRVDKYDLRVESYGTLDELNSNIGLVRDLMIRREKKNKKSSSEIKENSILQELLRIINTLFDIQSIIACEKEDIKKNIPQITEEDIDMLEKRIDMLSKELPNLKSFILPTGDIIASHTHIARTVCRRAERLLCKLNSQISIDENSLKYINRLSDYLFILSRKIMKDKNSEEILWKQRLNS